MPDAQASAGGRKLYTLSEVSKRTGISMPTLQRYKKSYQKRLPSVGKGRRQRYPEEALPVFQQIKEENIAKRGRPRKSGTKAASATGSRRRAAAKRTPPPKRKGAAKGGAKKAASGGSGLLTLTEAAKRAGISYPTANRYVKLHGSEIPHQGTGRKRRYHPEAVDVLKRLRQESTRGRKPAGGRKKAAAAGRKPAARKAASRRRSAASESPTENLWRQAEKRLKDLEGAYKKLEKNFNSLVTRLRKV